MLDDKQKILSSPMTNRETEEVMDSPATVFIVDDEREVRAALSRLLAAAGYQVQAFESAYRFLDAHDADAPGCLLLDVCLPGLSGIELQGVLAGSQRTRPIVFLTGKADIHTTVCAMKAGAVDFLTKPIESAKLFAAIEQALQRDAEQRLERAMCKAIEQRYKRLTPRETEVMTHVIRGRLNKQIADELGAGQKTIKVHRARVMQKMRARSVAELVCMAMQVGLLSLPPRLPREAACAHAS
jgi:FixJ family two-component response regulator